MPDARWLFGPEFESTEYASNRQLHSAVQTVFKKRISKESFNNYRQRPDIVLLNDSTTSIKGTEFFDNESNLGTVNCFGCNEVAYGPSRGTTAAYVDSVQQHDNIIYNNNQPLSDNFVRGKKKNPNTLA
ncbi:hypothetical protein [Mucilaginibacter oryzae]|uniref:hypothetical protein n=1 Tax=Mucilaginibacter oryzae TaxID=468058 RepID=UPI001B878E8A|nr:hypothetical protein [Mucilaginibacter oryzae]